MLYLARLLIVAIYVSAIGYSTSVNGQSAPARVSDIVLGYKYPADYASMYARS